MKWFLNGHTSLQGKNICLSLSRALPSSEAAEGEPVCSSPLTELVFVLSTLLNCSPESKGSAVSVFPVVIESRLKFDKWLCHSAEKQNSVDKVTKSFPALGVCFYWPPHSPVPPPKPGSTWCFLSLLLPCRKCLALAHPGSIGWKCQQKRQKRSSHHIQTVGGLCQARWLPSHPTLPPAVPVQSHIYTLIVTL